MPTSPPFRASIRSGESHSPKARRSALTAIQFAAVSVCLALFVAWPLHGSAQTPLKVFISVDMEGIGGIGTGAMVNSSGKDYATGRRLMTEEVNAVVAAILERGPAEILVNDSHGDMQNLLHTELDPRLEQATRWR